jgi:hypothetical protein
LISPPIETPPTDPTPGGSQINNHVINDPTQMLDKLTVLSLEGECSTTPRLSDHCRLPLGRSGESFDHYVFRPTLFVCWTAGVDAPILPCPRPHAACSIGCGPVSFGFHFDCIPFWFASQVQISLKPSFSKVRCSWIKVRRGSKSTHDCWSCAIANAISLSDVHPVMGSLNGAL